MYEGHMCMISSTCEFNLDISNIYLGFAFHCRNTSSINICVMINACQLKKKKYADHVCFRMLKHVVKCFVALYSRSTFVRNIVI